MVVNVQVQPLAGFPEVTGAHELAWSYILDAVFADAYHAGLSALSINLPSQSLKVATELRAELSRREGDSGAEGVVLLGRSDTFPPNCRRAYSLWFGRLAPRALQRLQSRQVEGWDLQSHLSVFTLKARLWGVPIRLFKSMNRPDLVDRAMFVMRRDFASYQSTTSYYNLNIWSCR